MKRKETLCIWGTYPSGDMLFWCDNCKDIYGTLIKKRDLTPKNIRCKKCKGRLRTDLTQNYGYGLIEKEKEMSEKEHYKHIDLKTILEWRREYAYKVNLFESVIKHLKERIEFYNGIIKEKEADDDS